MESATTTGARQPSIALGLERSATRASALGWALFGVLAAGIALRLPTLGLQSFHHDEVITAARVLPGSFGQMLHEVSASESTPPLYYALAWVWSQAFGTGEAGLRALSALAGIVTIPVVYLVGRELLDRRAGLFSAALVAVNPMLVWYSQEARAYALLVLLCSASLLFFLRARRSGRSLDLGLWSLFSALALTTHYFAAFPIAIEAAWLLVVCPSRRPLWAALGGIALTGAALVPLVLGQMNPHHLDWISNSSLPSRLLHAGGSFLAGETGFSIGDNPQLQYAVLPAMLVAGAAALALLGLRRISGRVALPLLIGVGTVGLATLAALGGEDYIVERNLLPALVPLLSALGIGLAACRWRGAATVFAAALFAFWLGFGVYVTQTPTLQRQDWRGVASLLGRPGRPRAIVTWRLGAAPLSYYLDDGATHGAGPLMVSEIDVVRHSGAAMRGRVPPGFTFSGARRTGDLTVARFVAGHPRLLHHHLLRSLQTGFHANAVLSDSPLPRLGPLT